MDRSAATPRRSYSTQEVADRLGISLQTVQRWVDAGRLQAWKTPGGHRRIDAELAEQLFAEQAKAVPAAGKPLRVLVVDDNPLERDVLAEVVSELLPGADVAVAENGFLALMAIGRQMPDLLLTDIVMPHMNGVEMIRQLYGAPPAQRPRLTIAVTSRSAAELQAMGGLPSAVQLLTKPMEPLRLRQLLVEGGFAPAWPG